MKKILHIIASPRGASSRTLAIADVFLESLRKKYPACQVDELNLFTEPLASLTVEAVHGKYQLLSGRELDEKSRLAWKGVIRHIERFLSADGYLVSTPMWNFNIPYPLKQYIDIIVQPKYLFRYTDKGVEGLVKNKRMVVVTSRGGDYSAESPFHSYDYQEPYLKVIFGFVGIMDIAFINAQPMDALGPEVQGKKIEEAKALARKLAGSF